MMKEPTLYLTLFCGLMVSVYSIVCNSCLERGSDTCKSEETTSCPDSSQCATVSGFIQNGTEKTPFIYKGCPFDIPDKSWLCISVNNFYMQSYVDYCSGEKCNSDYYIPEDDEEGNGLSCQSCYKEGTLDGCTPDGEINCRGDETLCVDYRGILEKPDGTIYGTSFKGCANPSGHSNSSLIYGLKEVQRILFSETNAN